jgi:hypothetical protein
MVQTANDTHNEARLPDAESCLLLRDVDWEVVEVTGAVARLVARLNGVLGEGRDSKEWEAGELETLTRDGLLEITLDALADLDHMVRQFAIATGAARGMIQMAEHWTMADANAAT